MLFVLMISKVTLQGKTFTNPTDLFEYLLNLRCIEDAVKLFNLGFKEFDNSGILHAGLFNSQAQFERTLKVTIGYVPLTKKDD